MLWRNNARSCSRASETWRIYARVRTSTWSGNAGEKVKILIKWSFPAWGELDELMCWLKLHAEKQDVWSMWHHPLRRRRRRRRRVCSIKLTETSLYILYILYIHVLHLVSFALCLTCSLVTSAPHSFFSVQQWFNASDCTNTWTIAGFLII